MPDEKQDQKQVEVKAKPAKRNMTLHASPATGGKAVACQVNTPKTESK